MKVEEIAQVCHEANAALCRAFGDNSQVPWDEAPEWQKLSSISGVRFLIENPNAETSATHEAWLNMKKAEGWKWGPEKNVDLKQHPCCVPYNALPSSERAKDHVFNAIVKTLLPKVT